MNNIYNNCCISKDIFNSLLNIYLCSDCRSLYKYTKISKTSA